MKKYEVVLVHRVHSLVQIPCYSYAYTSREKAEGFFKQLKADAVEAFQTEDWVIDKDDPFEYEADISGYRDYFHIFISEAETDKDFTDGECTKCYLGGEEDCKIAVPPRKDECVDELPF